MTGCINCGSDHPLYSCQPTEPVNTAEPEPKKLTTKEATKLVIDRVVGWYATHEIVHETADRWLLKKPGGTNEDWAEVASLAMGTLLVHGDHDPMLFGNMTDCRRPENVVHWMARQAPNDDYFVSKARRALGLNADAFIWNESIEAFCEELQDLIAEEEDEDRRAELQEILEDATESEDHDVKELQQDVYGLSGFDSESVPDGQVISSRMIHAWAIICRLSALLKARETDGAT